MAVPPEDDVTVGWQGVEGTVGSSGANVLAIPVARMIFNFSSILSIFVFNQSL